MAFNVAKIASARASLTISLTKSLRVAECIESQNANIILAGDTNIHLLKMHEHIMYCDFFDLLMTHNLCPHITLPTRFSNKMEP